MQLKLNKYDIILSFVVVILASIFLVFVLLQDRGDESKVAKVYYKNNLVHTFNLEDKKKQEFSTKATMGNVKIEAKNGKVRVVDETSRRNLCSIQGWSDSTTNPIVCLPNDLYIKIEKQDTSDEEVDVFIK
ncbi:MAG: NusG domain II-containing protein [Erysipelotrichales bacterium]